MDGLCLNAFHVWRDSSSDLYMYLYTIFTVQSVSQQLYRDNRKIIQQSVFPEENSVTVQLKSVQWCFIFVVKRYYFNSFISPIEAKMFKSFILICLCASKHQPISREQLICIKQRVIERMIMQNWIRTRNIDWHSALCKPSNISVL